MFSNGESTHGELSYEEMQGLLSTAKEYGWENALDRTLPSGKELVRHLIKDHRRHKSIELLEGLHGSVLDFGCGYGGISRALSSMFDNVVSIDASRQRVSFLNIIRKQECIQNISVACHNDVLNLPFADSHFEAVVMVGVLEYLPQSLPNEPVVSAHVKCLQSFFRIMKPGGYLLIQTKNRFGWQYLLGGRDNSGLPFAPALPIWAADAILRLSGRGHYRIINHSLAGYRRILQSAGFNSPRVFWPTPGYQMPDFVIDLDADLLKQSALFLPDCYSWIKRELLRASALVGVLRYITPNYTLLAQKPDNTTCPI